MGLKENLENESITQLPMREAILLAESTPVKDAVELMRQKHIGSTVVVDEAGMPLGKFTERSLIDLLLSDRSQYENGTVGNHLDAKFMTISAKNRVMDVLEAVESKGTRFIYVLDDEGKPIAVTGQRGMSEFVAEHFPQQVMVQRVGSRPATQTREGA